MFTMEQQELIKKRKYLLMQVFLKLHLIMLEIIPKVRQ